MDPNELFVGGKQGWATSSGIELPTFAYYVSDVAALRQRLVRMYVALDLRFTDKRELGLHLQVPDIGIGPWVIPLDKAQIPRIEKQFKILSTCPVVIAGKDGDSISLADTVTDLTFDWSGAYAQALDAFMAKDIAAARAALEPLVAQNPSTLPAAHHLLGRCYRAQNDLVTAIEHYRRAVRAATHTMGHLVPYAAGTLSDLGVAYKKLDQLAKAEYCFRHSLSMRPNHPSALISYFTLLGVWEQGLDYALTRVVAINDKALAMELATMIGQALSREPSSVLAAAIKKSLGVNLAEPLFDLGAFKAEDFFTGLDAVSGDPVRPALPAAAAAPPWEAPVNLRKPWWKFW